MFHVDEAKFTDWYGRMEAEYYRLEKLYDDEMKIRRRMPKENITTIDLPPLVKAKLETKAKSLFFSGDGVAKQLGHHPEVEIAEYVKVLNGIKDCNKDSIFPDGDYKVALIVHDDVWYRVAIKDTRSHTEAYLISLHRLNYDSLEAFLKKYDITLKAFLKSQGIKQK